MPPYPGEGPIPQFPSVEAKLQKPTRQSPFEKQKAEAQAKRQREAAETAAVYKDFVKSFEEDVLDGPRAPCGPRSSLFATRSRTPRTSKPPLGASAPSCPAGKAGQSKHIGPGFRPIHKVFMGSDDDDDHEHENTPNRNAERGRDPTQDKVISKPTLRLSNLPPGTSVSQVKSLVSPLLSVDAVKILSQQSPATERRYVVSIVTLSQDTPATDIDQAVSVLQHKYLGYGHYLSLHRHLSSAVTLVDSAPTVAPSSAPFGAKPLHHHGGGPPHAQIYSRRFPPPHSHGAGAARSFGSRGQIFHVPVRPPRDINQIRLIHHVLEMMLEHGPEFEALLMSRPEVQRDEKWAWLWDARSEDGVWYRWRLWEVVTGFDASTSRARYQPIFEANHAWRVPEKKLPFQLAISLDEFCSDPDYESTNDADVDDDDPPRDVDMANPEAEPFFLNPLNRARLTHLLLRLPTSILKLRKGDIARISAFAIKHASHGAEEVVDLVVWNVEKPFAALSSRGEGQGRCLDHPEVAGTGDRSTGEDSGASCLVGLYVVNDILSSSSTSGVRHAWRYRQLFEAALRRRRVFEMLGSMPERFNWGRLRAEKWKRSIGLVLSLWEGWCVFQTASHELFLRTFESPPAEKAEQQDVGEDGSKRKKWKVVEGLVPGAIAEGNGGSTGFSTRIGSTAHETGNEHDETGVGQFERMQDVDGEPMSGWEDVDGEPMSDGDPVSDGEPMSDGDIYCEPADEYDAGSEPQAEEHDGNLPRKRIRAVDMFGDTDDGD